MTTDATIAPPTDALRTAWTALLEALTRAGYATDQMLRPGADAAEIAAAQKAIGRALPADLAGLYQLSDGQIDWYELTHGAHANTVREQGNWVCALFGDGWNFDPLVRVVEDWIAWKQIREAYTAQQLADGFDRVVEVRGEDPVRGMYTCADWIGFATDGGGNQLAVDLAPQPGGTVGQVIVIGSDEDLRRVIATGVLDLLRRCTERVAETDPDQADGGVLLYELERGDPI